MLEREKNVHKGCPNEGHCEKDESKCCYLVKQNCLLDNNDCEDFL